MVDNVPITKHRGEDLARIKELNEDMDLEHKVCLCFDCEKQYFDTDENELLDDEEICMVDTKASL